MAFLSRLNPVGGLADFWTEFRRPNPYRWQILTISILLTGLLIWAFTRERVYLPPDKPKVVFINTFAEGRSLAEIRASNRANQIVKDRERREQEARDDAARDAYRALGRASGMDVDAIERKAAADRARAAAEEKRRLDRFVSPRPTTAPTDAAPLAD